LWALLLIREHVIVTKDDARMRLSSAAPDMSEILRGMSIASDTVDEYISADDYLQPLNHMDDYRHPSNPLHRVSTILCFSFQIYFRYQKGQMTILHWSPVKQNSLENGIMGKDYLHLLDWLE